MPDDLFSAYDAAYVLGALSPEDRHAFEVHLRTCGSCAEAVQELAGLPGLLARAAIDDPAALEAPPDLLPGLLLATRHEQSRQRWVSASGWLAAAACVVALVLMVVLRPTTPATVAASTSAMTSIAETPISAQISLTGVSWGTKIVLKCSYPDGGLPDGSYMLVVIDKTGNPEQVGSWKVLPGVTATMNASTDVAADDIGRLEVQTLGGQPILQLVR